MNVHEMTDMWYHRDDANIVEKFQRHWEEQYQKEIDSCILPMMICGGDIRKTEIRQRKGNDDVSEIEELRLYVQKGEQSTLIRIIPEEVKERIGDLEDEFRQVKHLKILATDMTNCFARMNDKEGMLSWFDMWNDMVEEGFAKD